MALASLVFLEKRTETTASSQFVSVLLDKMIQTHPYPGPGAGHGSAHLGWGCGCPTGAARRPCPDVERWAHPPGAHGLGGAVCPGCPPGPRRGGD